MVVYGIPVICHCNGDRFLAHDFSVSRLAAPCPVHARGGDWAKSFQSVELSSARTFDNDRLRAIDHSQGLDCTGRLIESCDIG